MKANSRVLLYAKNIFKMTAASKVRFFLTFCGITVSVFGFAISLILSNSYFDSKMDIYESADDMVAVLCTNSKDASGWHPEGEYENRIEDYVFSLRVNLDTVELTNGKSVSVVGIIHGVDTTDVVLQSNSSKYIPVQSKYLSGTGITLTDNQNQRPVAVIDEYTASFLYGDADNCIGNEIIIGADRSIVIGGEHKKAEIKAFTICGVLKDSVLTEHTKIENQKKIFNGEEHLMIYVDIYCPIGALREAFPNWQYVNNSIFYFDTAGNAKSFQVINQNSINSQAGLSGDSRIITADSLMEDLRKELKDTRTIIRICIIILGFIFSISITSVVFFAVKERIPEIGIRKAFGATKTDIVFQIFCEMILIAMVSSAAGILLSVYFSNMFAYYLMNRMFVYFHLYITASDILWPAVIGIAQAAICGIVPGIYGSEIPVTKALKFE